MSSTGDPLFLHRFPSQTLSTSKNPDPVHDPSCPTSITLASFSPSPPPASSFSALAPAVTVGARNGDGGGRGCRDGQPVPARRRARPPRGASGDSHRRRGRHASGVGARLASVIVVLFVVGGGQVCVEAAAKGVLTSGFLFWSAVLSIVAVGGVGVASVLRAGGELCPRGARNSSRRRSWLWSATIGLTLASSLAGVVSATSANGAVCTSIGDCTSGVCRGGNCCGPKGRSRSCTDCDTVGDCSVCSSGHTLTSSGECVGSISDGGTCSSSSQCISGICQGSHCCKGRSGGCTGCNSAGDCSVCSSAHTLTGSQCLCTAITCCNVVILKLALTAAALTTTTIDKTVCFQGT